MQDTDLLSMFSEKTDKLDPSKRLHVGMDGPNVNWNFYDMYIESGMKMNWQGW